MIWEKNNFQTVQECTKSCVELIALYVHPKNSNHLRSHLTAIMTLDHKRLGLENKFLESKSGRIFLRLPSLLALENLANKLTSYRNRTRLVTGSLAPIVQTLDSAIHRINHYPAEKYYGNQLRYPLDIWISGG